MPWSLITSGVIAEVCVVMGMEYFYFLTASGSAGTKISGNFAALESDIPIRAYPRSSAVKLFFRSLSSVFISGKVFDFLIYYTDLE
jgi:hypothetical protein